MAHVRALSFVPLFLVLAAVAGCSESHGQAEADAGTDAYFPIYDGWSGDVSLPLVDTGLVDAGALPDGGDLDGGVAPQPCTPQDAHEVTCPSAICDGLDSYAWDGERCVRIDCGTCMGADCGHLATSLETCEAAHAACVPELCRATGGEWLFYTEECHHYVCGNPQPSECLIGMPVCNCGDGRSFDATTGCFDDASCPVVDPLPPQTLCTSTGGAWMTGICCNTHCGQFCDLDCVADACACGPLQVFDPVRGCVDDAACHVHTVGQECNPQIRCQDGLICCQHCGGAGCDPTMTCEAPVCDADPNVDECGNNLLAP